MNNSHAHPIFQPILQAIFPPQKALTPYEQWQLDCYGNILPDMEHTPEEEYEESAYAELNRLSEFQEHLAEMEILDK